MVAPASKVTAAQLRIGQVWKCTQKDHEQTVVILRITPNSVQTRTLQDKSNRRGRQERYGKDMFMRNFIMLEDAPEGTPRPEVRIHTPAAKRPQSVSTAVERAIADVEASAANGTAVIPSLTELQQEVMQEAVERETETPDTPERLQEELLDLATRVGELTVSDLLPPEVHRLLDCIREAMLNSARAAGVLVIPQQQADELLEAYGAVNRLGWWPLPEMNGLEEPKGENDG